MDAKYLSTDWINSKILKLEELASKPEDKEKLEKMAEST
jgi:hypothetical protein